MHFKPKISLDTGEKAGSILYLNPNGGDDTTTTTTTPAAYNSASNSDRDDDNDCGNSNSNNNENGNASTVINTLAVTKTYIYYKENFLPRSSSACTITLRALSQTRVAWRHFFRPMIWENIELDSMLKDGTGAWYRKLAQGLIMKVRGISIEDAEVAKRVQRI